MKKTSRIQAVIFDLGNVLVDVDQTVAAGRIAKFSGKTPGEIYKLLVDSGITGLFEEGKISPGDFFLKIKETVGAGVTYDEFLPIWNEIFSLTPQNQQVHALIEDLSGRYRIALLSNTNVLHFAYLKENFPDIFSLFHQIIVSHETHSRKPDPAIYRYALNRLGVSAEQAFYTDDRPELVQAASGLGIHSFVFKGIAGLRSDLKNENIT